MYTRPEIGLFSNTDEERVFFATPNLGVNQMDFLIMKINDYEFILFLVNDELLLIFIGFFSIRTDLFRNFKRESYV